MIFSDEIEPAFINEQIALEGRLFVVGCHAGFEAGVRCLDIAVAMVDSDDYGLAVGVRVKIHSRSFLPLCGCKMIFGNKKKPVKNSHGPLAEKDYFVICGKRLELSLQIPVPFLGKNIPDICLHRGIHIIEGRFVYIS